MSRGASRGLAGRARYLHHRERDERKFANTLIAEYYEPREPQRSGAATAPIRGRSEFLPGISLEINMPHRKKATQLELPLDNETGTDSGPGRPSDRRVVWSTARPEGHEEDSPAVALVRTGSSSGSERRGRVGTAESSSPTLGSSATSKINDRQDPPGAHVLRPQRQSTARMPIGWLENPDVKPAGGFHFVGFLRGCAIGGAAAAAVLAALSLVLP